MRLEAETGLSRRGERCGEKPKGDKLLFYPAALEPNLSSPYLERVAMDRGKAPENPSEVRPNGAPGAVRWQAGNFRTAKARPAGSWDGHRRPRKNTIFLRVEQRISWSTRVWHVRRPIGPGARPRAAWAWRARRLRLGRAWLVQQQKRCDARSPVRPVLLPFRSPPACSQRPCRPPRSGADSSRPFLS